MKTSLETLNEKPMLSRKETALYLGLHVNSLDNAKIPHYKIGNRVLYSKSELLGWLELHRQGADNAESKQ